MRANQDWVPDCASVWPATSLAQAKRIYEGEHYLFCWDAGGTGDNPREGLSPCL